MLLSIFLGIITLILSIRGAIMPSDRKWVRYFYTGLGFLGIIIIVIQAWEQTREQKQSQKKIQNLQDNIELLQKQNLSIVKELEEANLRKKLESEANRRSFILNKLRQEWILSHDNISSKMMAGTEMPPRDWVNKRLKELKENWVY